MTLHIAEISSGSKYFVASTYQVTTGLLGKLDHTHGTERLTVHETARPKRLRSTYSMNAAANQWWWWRSCIRRWPPSAITQCRIVVYRRTDCRLGTPRSVRAVAHSRWHADECHIRHLSNNPARGGHGAVTTRHAAPQSSTHAAALQPTAASAVSVCSWLHQLWRTGRYIFISTTSSINDLRPNTVWNCTKRTSTTEAVMFGRGLGGRGFVKVQ